MALRVKHVIVGAREPAALAQFWAAALSATVSPDNSGFLLTSTTGESTPILFTQLDESGTQPAWPTLLLSSSESTLADYVRFLLGLGAHIVDDAPRGPMIVVGLGSVTMADPEGNQFIVESTDAERQEVQQALDSGQEVDTSRSYFAGRGLDPQFMATAQARVERT